MQESHAVTLLCSVFSVQCSVFSVQRSSFRYWKLRPKGLKLKDVLLQAQVKAAHELSGGSAGARTIATMVSKEGEELSRYLASKAMKMAGLESCQPPNIRRQLTCPVRDN